LEIAALIREAKLPERIDREMMKKRGQMGLYWNSRTVWKKKNKPAGNSTYTQADLQE
jgi:hypothetical protein